MRIIFHGHWKGWFRNWPRVTLHTVRETVFKAPVFEIEGDDHVVYMTSTRVHAKGVIRRRRCIVIGAPDRTLARASAFLKVARDRLWCKISPAGDVSQFEESVK